MTDEKFLRLIERLLDINAELHLLHAKRLEEIEAFLEEKTLHS